MKNRFLALLICAILVFSIIPFGKNIKASQTNNNAKQLNTPEQMAAVMREKANNNIARMKGKITQSQVNATIKQKLIVKTKDEIENTYGANSVYYYTVGNYQILFYDTAEEAKNACEKLEKGSSRNNNISRYTNHTKRSRQKIMDQMKWRHTMELKKWEWINLRKKKTVGKIKVPKLP